MKTIEPYFGGAVLSVFVSLALSIYFCLTHDETAIVLVLTLMLLVPCLLVIVLPLAWKRTASPAHCVFVLGATLFHSAIFVSENVQVLLVVLPPIPFAWTWPWSLVGGGIAVSILASFRRQTWKESPGVVSWSVLFTIGGILMSIAIFRAWWAGV